MAVLTHRDFCYWMFHQLYQEREGVDNWFINFRCVHNGVPFIDMKGKEKKPTESLFNKNIPVNEFYSSFLTGGGLFDKLTAFNQSPEKPTNNYYGVNPRTSSFGNKKQHVAGFIVYYLDLDDNKNYTKEERLAQINFWISIGYAPSFVIDSGHGYHPYWILSRLATQEEGETCIRNMTKISGCKEGGNVCDVTRQLRLPGFFNQKLWFAQDQPLCQLIYPAIPVIEKSFESTPPKLVFRYTPEQMLNFPASEKEDIRFYTEQAAAMEGDPSENMINVVKSAIEHRLRAQISHAGGVVAARQVTGTKPPVVEKKIELNKEKIPPDVTDLPWPKGKKLLYVMYCYKGWEDLTQGESDNFRNKFSDPGLSASEMDFRVLFQLIRMGYTQKAIREFWKRPGLGLYRADKEEKSPGYFERSFESALQCVNDALTTANEAAKEETFTSVSISVKNNITFIKKGDNSSRLFNFEVALKQILRDKNALTPEQSEYYKTEISSPPINGSKKPIITPQIFPREAYNDIKKMRQCLTGSMVVLSNTTSDLQEFIEYLLSTFKQVSTVDFHSKITYTGKEFILPYVTVKKDGFNVRKYDEFEGILKKKFVWHNSFVSEPISKEDFAALARKSWNSLVHLHHPTLILSVLGQFGASIARTIMHHEELALKMNIPILNVRGSSSRGKTDTMEILHTLYGFRKPKQARQSINITTFALNRLSELSNFIPMIIDEFKETRGSEGHIERIRDFVRRTYSGEMMSRGHADQSISTYTVSAPVVVIGETPLERVGNISEVSRVFPVTVDQHNVTESYVHFKSLCEMPLWHYGPYFLQHALTHKPEDLYKQYNTYLTYYEKVLSRTLGQEATRVAGNIAALRLGCYLYESFVHEYMPRAPLITKALDFEKNVTEHLSKTYRESGQLLTYQNPEKKETIIQSKNEVMEFLETLGAMITNKEKEYLDYAAQEIPLYKETDNNLLWINVTPAHNAYTQFCNRVGKDKISIAKIKASLRETNPENMPWLVSRRKSHRFETRIISACCFKLKILQQMNIWPDSFQTGSDTVPEPPGEIEDAF